MEISTKRLKGQSLIQAHVWVSGRVQGIFFRATALVEARKRNISGWVRNLPDARVEIVCQGKKQDVADFIQWCKRGPPLAHVDHVEVSFESPSPGLDGFVLREYVSGLLQAVKNRCFPK